MLFCNDALLTEGVKERDPQPSQLLETAFATKNKQQRTFVWALARGCTLNFGEGCASVCLAVKIRTWLCRFRALAQPPSISGANQPRGHTWWQRRLQTTPPHPKKCGLVETHWFRSSGPHLEVHTSRAFLCLRREARPSWNGYGWAGQCTAIERVELIPKLDRTVIAWLRNGIYYPSR